ncbi:hypothetical protein AYO38_09890 [bacterium SCGC AG-212-C10]|nr:hypothetical protein AYO38_09890 [bacterium SCGC AG-212-C10]
MTTLAERAYSAADLLEMEDGEAFELEDGVLREHRVGYASEWAAVRLLGKVDAHAEQHQSGRMVPTNTGLRIFGDDGRSVPRSDGGYISFERAGDRHFMPRGYLAIPPELLIESISPTDEMGYMHRKIRRYLDAGVDVVWVLFPDTSTAEVYHSDGTSTFVPADGYLSGEAFLPGFRCALSEIMPAPYFDAAE